MSRNSWSAALLFVVLVGGACAANPLSPCDYAPAESSFVRLSTEGSLQWYDDAYTDDRGSSLSGSALADFRQIYDSGSFAYRVEASTELSLRPEDLQIEATVAGDYKRYFRDDVFTVGAVELSGDIADGFEANATGGFGAGRFRDVTPLAKAIKIQNAFLDAGILLAPVEEVILLEAAQTLGEVGPTQDEKIAQIEQLLLETGLVKDDDIGAMGLLRLEEIVVSLEEARLCGWDVQVRVGVSASAWPFEGLVDTLVLDWNWAVVPVPVLQWVANATLKLRPTQWEHYVAELELATSRRLQGNWRLRADYRLSYDHLWSDPDPTVDHRLHASLLAEVAANLSVSLTGEIGYDTGDEEPTAMLTVHLAYDVL